MSKEITPNLISINNKESSIKKRLEIINYIAKKTGLDILYIPSNSKTSEDNFFYEKKIVKFSDFFQNLQLKLEFINIGATGIVFKAVDIATNTPVCAIKVSSYSRNIQGDRQNDQRPENVDILISKLLSEFVTKGKTPHIILPLACFHTKLKDVIDFCNINTKVNEGNKSKPFSEFISSYNKNTFDDFAQILLMEWCEEGDLYTYIKKNYKSMKVVHWAAIFFQLLFTLCKIYEKYPNFRHNDLKPNNILVKKVKFDTDLNNTQENTILYILDSKWNFVVPNIGINILIADFDFASIKGIIENTKVNCKWAVSYNICSNKDHYYDIHFFFGQILSGNFFRPILEDPNSIPTEIKQFLERVIPTRYRSEYKSSRKDNDSDENTRRNKLNKGILTDKGRILVRESVTDPFRLLTEDPLFKPFRKKYTTSEY